MRFQFINCFVLMFLISCSSPTNESSSTNDSISIVDENSVGVDNLNPREDWIPIKSIDLTGKIFEVGSKTDFTDSCAFYFECDCCYGHLIFNSDSTFYNQNICVADLTITIGKYSVREDILTLDYSGKYISQIYNWDYDTDTTVSEYNYKDTLIQSFSGNYLAYWCNDKLALQKREPADEILLQSKDDYRKSFFLWENDSVLNKLKAK